jgi:hypothetical protein
VTAVLFTCAGQRVDIVEAFGRAGATTIATDLDPLAPALYHADLHAFAPRVADAGYVPRLAELVAEHNVRLIVPLTDLDHVTLAEPRALLDLAERSGSLTPERLEELAELPTPLVGRLEGRHAATRLLGIATYLAGRH